MARGPVRHAITHRRITVHPFAAEVEAARARDRAADDDRLGWYDPHAPGVATSALLDKLLRACSGARRTTVRSATRKARRHARHA